SSSAQPLSLFTTIALKVNSAACVTGPGFSRAVLCRGPSPRYPAPQHHARPAVSIPQVIPGYADIANVMNSVDCPGTALNCSGVLDTSAHSITPPVVRTQNCDREGPVPQA